MKKRIVIITLIAIAGVIVSLWQLSALSDGVEVSRTMVGTIPVSVFRLRDAPPAPVMVIAHGFAGSQQLMQPLALTLARNGYIAVTFDFAGHGRNPEPLPGGIADLGTSTKALLSELGQIAAYAQALPYSDHKLALIGHSMASELVVQYAMDHQNIAATAALSLFGQGITSDNPKNLIVIDGAWEISFLKDAAIRITQMVSQTPVRERETYGDFSKGNARRYVFAGGAEHIGVLYSADSLRETVAWMDGVFDRRGSGFIDQRGKWLALFFASLVALAFPASRLLPVISPMPLGSGLPWRRFWPVAIGPALLTPLILWKLPTNFLPILLGDYLVVHLALYGVLTGAGIWLSSRNIRDKKAQAPFRTSIVLAGLALAAYYILVLGMPLDTYVTSFMPTWLRVPLIAAMLCGTLIYFLADEWLTSGLGHAKGGYAFTKFCFVVSLIIAIALNPQKLFFLAIIVPVILILFIVYGLISSWVYGRTGDPRVAAIGTAAALAWAIAVIFPVVG